MVVRNVTYVQDSEYVDYNLFNLFYDDDAPESAHAGYNVPRLAKAIDPMYHVWKINKKRINKGYGFQLISDVHHPNEIEIPNFKQEVNKRVSPLTLDN